MIVNKIVKESVDVKLVNIFVKVSPETTITLYDNTNRPIKGIGGRLPKFLVQCDCDYIDLTINIETGQVLNWRKPLAEELEDAINK